MNDLDSTDYSNEWLRVPLASASLSSKAGSSFSQKEQEDDDKDVSATQASKAGGNSKTDTLDGKWVRVDAAQTQVMHV